VPSFFVVMQHVEEWWKTRDKTLVSTRGAM
jgi:hypothetical protein